MTQIMPWIERKFQFDLPKWMYPHVVERVRGGPARAEDIVRDAPKDLIKRRSGEAWSMQENIGHLLDLESLWAGRLDELLAGSLELRAWEETNRATWEADHNSNSIETILAGFRSTRSHFVDRLDKLDDSLIERTAFHPRLKKPMRMIDLVFFVAEHDDYHLARITRLKKLFLNGPPQ